MGRIIQGDALTVLSGLSPDSVHLCVTSPPYWGLRNYKVPPTTWGGDPSCSHDWQQHVQPAMNGAVDAMKGETKKPHSATRRAKRTAFCSICGAWRGQLGHEPTPQLYVQHMVMIFREVRRVLREDGNLFLNLGDSYASGKGTCHNPGGGDRSMQRRVKDNDALVHDRMNQSDLQAVGLKPKDLVGIPWMVAFALRDDGWYLRRDIIWEKPNPMPESTRDRCTSAHEYIFHLTKSARYFYDAFAIRETGKSDPDSWKKAPAGWADNDGHHGSFHAGGRREAKKQRGHERKHQGIALWDGLSKTLQGMLMRNKRSVWTIATRPFKGAHFATFPSEIPITAIQAGTSHKGCCHVCGAPYERIIKRAGKVQMDRAKSKKARQVVEEYRGPVSAEGGVFNTGELPILETAGWRQTCECKISAAVPCTVLEPFAGSGTTLEAAARLGREYVGIEINEHDIKTLIEPRLAGINPLFTLFRDEQG